MTVSVRARLTVLVALVALLLGVIAATVGVDAVGDQLIADELDDSGSDQLVSVVELLTFEAEETAFVVDFSVQLELESLSFALAELLDSGALAALLEAASYEMGEAVPLLTYFGQIMEFDPLRLTLDGPKPLGDDGRSVIPQSVVDELVFLTVDFELEDVFNIEDEFEKDNELAGIEQEAVDAKDRTPVDPDGLIFDTRPFDGVDYVVFADISGIDRSIDRIRTIVWTSVPVLVIAGGLIAWLLTGRALRPVQGITARVGAISSGNLHERVPEPGTGDEIAELAATMNAMLDRLEVDDRRLRQFVSDASHELRSPVAVLRSEAEVAQRTPERTSVESLADGVLAESARLQQIVEDLLILARGEERQAGSQWAEVDVDDIVLAEAARRRNVPVDTSAVSAGRILGTPELVGRIVTHLLDNAARHGTGRVEVGLTADAGGVRLWVDDDGPGVPLGDRARIFQRFTRLDDARSRDRGGAGLGLAVVAESVRSLGGRIDVEDAPIGGARFIVRLPTVSR